MPPRKEKLKRLYNEEKLSMAKIAERLGISHSKVYYWFKKYEIKRRNLSESIYLKQNPEGDPFNLKDKLTQKDKKLLLASVMLYWAEGSKKCNSTIQIANLDEKMLKIFRKFLKEICNINEEKIRLYVRVYGKFNKQKIKKYWSNCLNLPLSQIFIYPHKDNRSKPDKQWSENGIATLQVSNVKLKKWINNVLYDFLNQLLSG